MIHDILPRTTFTIALSVLMHLRDGYLVSIDGSRRYHFRFPLSPVNATAPWRTGGIFQKVILYWCNKQPDRRQSILLRFPGMVSKDCYHTFPVVTKNEPTVTPIHAKDEPLLELEI